MVFVDGQNLYKRCEDYFGHALCHPHLLAEHLAGARSPESVSTRFYTGQPDPNVDDIERRKRSQLDRRLAGMRKCGVTTITRELRYHWTWGPAYDQRRKLERPGPNAGTVEVWTEAYKRGAEKGIDLAIGLEVVEFAVKGNFDVAIIVSFDRDLHEIPKAMRNVRDFLPKPVRIEAAVPVALTRTSAVRLPGFSFTHQITESVFQTIRDDTDYTLPKDQWTPPVHPQNLREVGGFRRS